MEGASVESWNGTGLASTINQLSVQGGIPTGSFICQGGLSPKLYLPTRRKNTMADTNNKKTPPQL